MKLTDKNRLSTTHPELCKEWDYEKNGDLTPWNVSYACNKRVWWKCEKQHSYESKISNRTYLERGCPYCSNQKVCKDNCLAIINPQLSLEWDYEKNYPLTPKDVVAKSCKIVGWICQKGHRYYCDVRKKKVGCCPYCSGNRVCIDNCLAALRPELISEWHPTKNGKLTPWDITSRSNRLIWWKCKKGHEWECSANNRFKNNTRCGCPYCSGHRVCIDNCLATVNPELAKEWHPTKNGKLTPWDITCGSARKIHWRCSKCKYEWVASIGSRNRGQGCPCRHKIILKDGTICDSLFEAHFYLLYKSQNLKFIHHGKYGGKLGSSIYDFYFPNEDKYIEITGFTKKTKWWKDYLKKINKKKKYVEMTLKGTFEFIQYKMTKGDFANVRSQMI